MKRFALVIAPLVLLPLVGSPVAWAQSVKPAKDKSAAVRVGNTGLTLYNQNFAVVLHALSVNVRKGANHIAFENVTSQLEPDSVVLRDPTDKWAFRIEEQSYRNDTASTESLLPRFEGKTLSFLVASGGDDSTLSGVHPQIVTGKLIRAGTRDSDYRSNRRATPIVEVDGKLRFGLPGTPIFPPELLSGLLLRPTLQWTLTSETAGLLNAEVAYVSGGFSWQASYNLVSPEVGDRVDLVGWVTMGNQSGRTFENARIQLVAGDVRKIQPERSGYGGYGGGAYSAPELSYGPPPVTEKAFDEYHLYTLRNPTSLRDREQKQVEFARGTGIASKRLYVYDGEQTDPSRTSSAYSSYSNYSSQQPDTNTQQNTKVWVMREFANTAANGLGIPLPRGRMRLYRREADTNALQFVGEGVIGHTPSNEMIRLYSGDAFDIVGERRLVSATGTQGMVGGPPNRELGARQENWEIKLRNRKTEPVEVRVVEHLHPLPIYRTAGEITKSSDPFVKINAFTVEFRVTVKPDEEKIVTYSVDY